MKFVSVVHTSIKVSYHHCFLSRKPHCVGKQISTPETSKTGASDVGASSMSGGLI